MRVKTIFSDDYEVDDKGFVYGLKSKKIITPVLKNGYFSIRLSKLGKVSEKSLHRLVYESFNGKITQGNQINHINGIRSDNSLKNLEEVTPKQNIERMLFLARGEQVSTSKLTDSQVMDIRKRKSEGASSLALAKEYGLVKSTINRIASGKYWKHLPILPVDNSFWSDAKKTGAMTSKTLVEKYGKDYFKKIARLNRFKKHCKTCTCTITT